MMNAPENNGGGSPLRRVLRAPDELLSPARFDICAKHIYARWRGEGWRSQWGQWCYEQHILALNGGVEQQGDVVEKTGVEEFRRAYHQVLDGIKTRGFDSSLGALPADEDGVLMNGAHRAAACIYYRTATPVDIFAGDGAHYYDYRFFDKRGLDADVLDFMAVEYALLDAHCRLFLIWPSAEKYISQIRQMAAAAGRIVCEKKIKTAHSRMAVNTVCQVYSGEPWLPTSARQKEGGNKKSTGCFGGGAMYVFLLHIADAAADELKNAVRKLAGIGNDSAHSTDDRAETVRLARLFFNRNSLHHLAFARPPLSPVFWERINACKESPPADAENFCIHGSAVMEAYGIRESRDLNYISADGTALPLSHADINISNEKPALAGMNIADAVEDPRNYFHFHGIKFASLQAVIQMKKNRGEDKDRRDLRMIQSCISGGYSLDAAAAWWRRRFPKYRRRMIHKIIKARLGIGKK